MAVTKKERIAAYEHIFVNQAWGDRANAGKNYKRGYGKSAYVRGDIQRPERAVQAAE